MTDQTKDPILERLEADLARVQNNREVYLKWIASGKTLALQNRLCTGEWVDFLGCVWKPGAIYRIRPEPRTIWVNEYPGRFVGIFETEHLADCCATNDRIRAVEFVEVIK